MRRAEVMKDAAGKVQKPASHGPLCLGKPLKDEKGKRQSPDKSMVRAATWQLTVRGSMLIPLVSRTLHQSLNDTEAPMAIAQKTNFALSATLCLLA